eukprot:scaffold1006_cov114-Skeletonema_dohrnii-CCMP3373.AAC.10
MSCVSQHLLCINFNPTPNTNTASLEKGLEKKIDGHKISRPKILPRSLQNAGSDVVDMPPEVH